MTAGIARSLRRTAPTWGPILIVVATVGVLYRVAFLGMIPPDLDTQSQFLPWFCFMGRSISAGQIPAWNPYAMGGAPFAANPQSGWMNLPVMALFATLPCGLALSLYLLLKPILGGLGIYWFLRSEGCSRPSATAGGLVLALGLAGSSVGASQLFSGVIAWSAVMLAAASRYRHAASWSGRLLWAALTGVAWTQVAAAHLSHGLVLGTGALITYLTASIWQARRAGQETWPQSLGRTTFLVGVLPAAGLAYLVPRLAYLSRSSLGHGYRELWELSRSLAGLPPVPFGVTGGRAPTWALDFWTPEGAYVAALGSIVLLAGLWLPRHRALAIAFVAFAAVCFTASLQVVAEAIAPFTSRVPLGDFAMQLPSRFGHGLYIALPVLVGLGVDAWVRGIDPRWARIAVPITGALLLPLPWLFGLQVPVPLLLLGGILAGGAILVVTARRPSLSMLAPLALAAELGLSAIMGQASDDPKGRFVPSLKAGAVLDPGVVGEIPPGDGSRVLTLGRDEVRRRAEANRHSALFRMEESGGYDPVQPFWYWQFVRAANAGTQLRYQSAIFRRPSPVVLDLLQVGWVVGPATLPPRPGWERVATEGGFTLYRLPNPGERASVVTEWRRLSEREALRAVLHPGFRSDQVAFVQEPLGVPSSSGGAEGMAEYSWTGTQSARIQVVTARPGLVLVRNVYDPGWRATVDGRPAPVVRADVMLQAVPIPPGRHVVELAYGDPSIMYGLVGSAGALSLLFAGSWVLWRRGLKGASAAVDGGDD